MGDYDDLADREEDKVPDDLTDQSDIREWLEGNRDYDPHNAVDRKDKLYDEVSERIAHSREGVTVDGEMRYYDPSSGRWREEGGLFTGDPFDGE